MLRHRPSNRHFATEKEIKEVEKEWEKYQVIAEVKRRLEDSSLGFTEEKYLKIKEDLTKTFGFNPSENDIRWEMSNQLLEEAMKAEDWHRMKKLYFNMALSLHQESKNCFKMLQEAARCELVDTQKSKFVEKVKILTAGNQACSVCQKLMGRILTIKEALREMPIPVKNCSFKLNPEAPTGWCRCLYIPVLNEDVDRQQDNSKFMVICSRIKDALSVFFKKE